MSNAIGKIGQTAKISAGLFWADCAVLGSQVQELEAAGVDWLHAVTYIKDALGLKVGPHLEGVLG
jgi:hypothetical protein